MEQKKKFEVIEVSPQFKAKIPPEPKPTPDLVELSTLATSPEKRSQLVCKKLLGGRTLDRAKDEAFEVLPKILSNTQILALFGNDTLEAVNQLNDRMFKERPPVDIPELQLVMKNLRRRMRSIGKKYDPSDPRALKRYEKTKSDILTKFHIVKTFLQEFLDDVGSLQQPFDWAIQTLGSKQYELLKNVAYYDEFYRLNEQEVDNLIYKIGVMEIMCDLAAKKASNIPVGNSDMGDRGAEEQAQILEIVNLLENKITAFKGRLWVAWAMAPQIRNMRAISIGLSARVDQTIGITIPTMKDVIVIWLTLSEAQQTEQFNKAVEDTYNNVMTLFANAAKAAVPMLANALSTPALDPRTIVAWSESLSAQADGIIQALEDGRQKRAELEQAMITGKEVIDTTTLRVNKAQLEYVLEAAKEDVPLEISHSVSEQESEQTAENK